MLVRPSLRGTDRAAAWARARRVSSAASMRAVVGAGVDVGLGLDVRAHQLGDGVGDQSAAHRHPGR